MLEHNKILWIYVKDTDKEDELSDYVDIYDYYSKYDLKL